MPEYDEPTRAVVADHIEALPDGHPVGLFIADYGVMRKDSRACAGK